MTDANPSIISILHASLLVADTERALAFYQGILGLTVNTERPNLGYPGAWLQVGDQEIHLLELPNPDPVNNRPAHGGRDRHVALAISDFQGLKDRLQQHNIHFTLSRSGRAALFVRDPDSNALEFIAQENLSR
jgi:glyoxylase I family protein